MSYSWGWRSLLASPGASRGVRAQRGDFLSDALRVSRVVDERDSAVVHTEGWGARLAAEVGGLFPGARYSYLKQRADWVWAAPLSESVAINVSLGGGIVFGLRDASRGGAGGAAGADAPSPRDEAQAAAAGAGVRPATPLAERFFLGGCDSVRGFAYRGLGPSSERPPRRDDAAAAAAGSGAGGSGGTAGAAAAAGPARDALGGDLFAQAYVGLVARLPGSLGDIGGCAHAFVNGGSASLLSAPPRAVAGAADGGNSATALLARAGGAAGRRAAELAAGCRWSSGVGLVLPTPFGRFEANYVWVLSSQPGDVPKAGLQFGFAASPLAASGPV